MKKQAVEKDDFDRLIALRALRENIYLQHPGAYMATDIAEDLPGRLRSVAPLFNEVLPSRVTIDSDPEKRKEQIRIAMERIKATRSSKTELGKQMLHNAAVTGAVGLPIGFMLAAGIKLMGFRSPVRFGKWNMKAHSPEIPAASYKGTSTYSPEGWSLQSPVTPIKTIRKFLANRRAAGTGVDGARKGLHSTDTLSDLAAYAGREGAIGAGMGAATGALYPAVSHAAHLSDDRLDEAAAILQEHPYMTSLPMQDMLASIDDKRTEQQGQVVRRAKGALLGGTLGAATGAVGAYTPAVLGLLGQAAMKPFTHKPLNFSGFSRVNKREILPTLGFTGGIGAVAGAASPGNPLG